MDNQPNTTGTDESVKAKPKRESQGSGKGGYVTISAACKKGRHYQCYAQKCECTCRHGVRG